MKSQFNKDIFKTFKTLFDFPTITYLLSIIGIKIIVLFSDISKMIIQILNLKICWLLIYHLYYLCRTVDISVMILYASTQYRYTGIVHINTIYIYKYI